MVAALGASAEVLRGRAGELAAAVSAGAPVGLRVEVEPCKSTVGGGAMPTAELASWAVTLAGRPADAIEAGLRAAPVPVVARVADDRVWLDVRTVHPDELADVVAAVASLGIGA